MDLTIVEKPRDVVVEEQFTASAASVNTAQSLTAKERSSTGLSEAPTVREDTSTVVVARRPHIPTILLDSSSAIIDDSPRLTPIDSDITNELNSTTTRRMQWILQQSM